MSLSRQKRTGPSAQEKELACIRAENLFIAAEEKEEYMNTEAAGKMAGDGDGSLWKMP